MADEHITIPRARLQALEAAEEALEAASRIMGERAQAMREVVAERDRVRAQVAALQAENANLRTVMIAAAEEIQAHWDAHCDAEGYGPANLMRRLEAGIPAEYGYTAGAFAALQAERDDAREELAAVLADWNALVAAIGSPTHGGAVGHARQVVAERDALIREAHDNKQRARAFERKAAELQAERDELLARCAAAHEAHIAALAERDALRAELDLRRKSGSASDRLHNLCQSIAAEADGSEWSREEWDRIDAENAALRKDRDLLDWLDRQNLPKRIGWSVGVSPAGSVSIQKVVAAVGEPTPIRAAIDAARSAKGAAR